jgi:dihydrofolate reductase
VRRDPGPAIDAVERGERSHDQLRERAGRDVLGGLLQTLLRHDLVDTLRIWQFPVVLGAGKRLFGEGAIPVAFRLVESEQTAAGAVLHVYERAGKLRYGEVEIGRETRVFEEVAGPRARR